MKWSWFVGRIESNAHRAEQRKAMNEPLQSMQGQCYQYVAIAFRPSLFFGKSPVLQRYALKKQKYRLPKGFDVFVSATDELSQVILANKTGCTHR